VPDLGAPIAYLVVRAGLPVYHPNGDRIGEVEHVLADEPSDIFHGLIIRVGPPGPRHAYLDADQIAELRERGVLLSVDGAAPYELTGQAGAAFPSDIGESKLQARLREAREWVSEH
jgi:uncharacterized protein YrrD